MGDLILNMSLFFIIDYLSDIPCLMFNNDLSDIEASIDKGKPLPILWERLDLHLDERGSGLGGDEVRTSGNTNVEPIDGLTIGELASLG